VRRRATALCSCAAPRTVSAAAHSIAARDASLRIAAIVPAADRASAASSPSAWGIPVWIAARRSSSARPTSPYGLSFVSQLERLYSGMNSCTTDTRACHPAANTITDTAPDTAPFE
jgi:hypothetical protein